MDFYSTLLAARKRDDLKHLINVNRQKYIKLAIEIDLEKEQETDCLEEITEAEFIQNLA